MWCENPETRICRNCLDIGMGKRYTWGVVIPRQLPRGSVLPDLDHSRAVLVGHGDGRRHGAEELTGCLAEALISPDAGHPFHPWRVQVLINSMYPSEIIDAVERAADEA